MSLPVTAILLAAGESTRMGTLKALLSWDGRTLLEYQVSQLLAAGVERVVAILGHRRNELERLLPTDPRVYGVINPDFASGKASSIRAGVAAARSDAHLLILGVDQPRPAALIRRAMEAHARGGHMITVAGHGGRRGHPVVFSPALRSELLQIDEESQGLRAVLHRHAEAVNTAEVNDPLALVNLNTPEDYEAALLLNSTESDRAGNQ